MVVLTKLFNKCSLHGYVTKSFGSSITSPVVEDNTNNLEAYDNIIDQFCLLAYY